MHRTRVNADYLQIGFNQEIYHPWGEVKPSADIVFMGRHYGKHFPFSVERMNMVKHLKERYGDRFQVFGTGWPWETQNLGHKDEAAHYRGAKIAIGISQFALGRYTSDRLHRAMGSGPLYMTRSYPDMELEFGNQRQLLVWDDFDHLDHIIDVWLEDDEERQRIAFQGCELLHERHTWLDRMYQLAEMIGWHPWK
jgi:spore maturation protein CgeB